MASATDPLGATIRTALDRFGKATTVIDPLGQTTTLTRDTLGQVLTTTEPNGHSVTNSYTGYLVSQVHDNTSGRTINYAYSNVNMLKTISGDVTRTDFYYYPSVIFGPLNGLLDSVYVGNTGTYDAPTGGFIVGTRAISIPTRPTAAIRTRSSILSAERCGRRIMMR